MKKLKKIGKKTVLRSSKLSHYRQDSDIQFEDHFIFRPDVFDFLGLRSASTKPQQAQ